MHGRHSLVLVAALFLMAGCRTSDYTIHVKGQELAVGQPRQFPVGSFPFAISRDGSRVAVLDGMMDLEAADQSDIHPILHVVDAKTFEPIGKALAIDDPSGITFDAGGSKLFVGHNDKYVSWDFVNDTFETVASEPPSVAPIFPGDIISNFDHSILVKRPGGSLFLGNRRPEATEGTAGTALVNGRPFSIPFTQRLGFDPYGDFWYQAGGKWTKISRSGEVTTASTRPKSLADDQTKDRGRMHLTVTTTEVKFKDSVAQVHSVWLTDDGAVPDPLNPQVHYQAALVFSGADVFDFGFVPHQQMVYVVTATGSYLVPYEYKSDEKRAKLRKRQQQQQGVGAPKARGNG